jgi:type I restriction-modification system DNA methylase subunit
VSESTRRNWRKLRTSAENRLTRRANKQLSLRNIMPLEYFRNRKNTGVVRRFVQRFSEGDFQLEDALFTAGVLLLKQRGISERENVRRVLAEYPLNFLPELAAESLPDGEFDLLGLLYQSLLTEGNKNRKGSYYTPEGTVRKILRGIRISAGMRFLDPCCGSGAFLLSVKCEDPRSLCGRDSDPVAVMLSKFNLLLKYAEFDFIPDIRCEDYLLSSSGELFDCVATNPPWGAADTGGFRAEAVSSGESFSLFFVKSFRALKPGGSIRFLLPRSVLNIRRQSFLLR